MPARAVLPDPDTLYPVILPDGTAHRGTVFLRPALTHPRFDVGDYTYASDFDPPDNWAVRLAPYLFEFSRERLTIGKFGQIAHGVRFITSSANHETRTLTSFPFPIFDPKELMSYNPDSRDTVLGHDVWLGNSAMVLPGARIGNGVIIGAGAVVRGTVPDFAVVLGNPAQIVRMRFSDTDIARLNALAWWDWPPAAIARARPALDAGDVAALEAMAPAALPDKTND